MEKEKEWEGRSEVKIGEYNRERKHEKITGKGNRKRKQQKEQQKIKRKGIRKS